MQGAVEAAAISLARDSNEAQNDENREPWTDEEMVERARIIITANLSYLEGDRLQRALDTLTVTVERSFSGPVVFATADLGGALNAPAFRGHWANIDATYGKSGGGCENITIEFVFALDMSYSMNGKVRSGERRLDVAVDTAKTLITDIIRACPDGDLRIGIVPWDSTVRLPNPSTADWVDTSIYTDPADWWGCIESTQDEHAVTRDAHFASILSKAVPGPGSVRAYHNPDTSKLTLPVALIEHHYAPGLREALRLPDTEEERKNVVDRFNLQWQNLRDIESGRDAQGGAPLGSNHWGAKYHWDTTSNQGHRGGPNFGCTPIAMLPMTGDPQRAIDALDAIKALSPHTLNAGHTHGYLGPLWAARLLDPDWHEVWRRQDAGVAPKAPLFPANHVRSIVLLTDGVNESNDPWETLPGRAAFTTEATCPYG